jgi:hypothetical protein
MAESHTIKIKENVYEKLRRKGENYTAPLYIPPPSHCTHESLGTEIP